MSLPKGGGAIRGIGEKFAANPVTGTGSMSVPIAASPGRSGFAPALALSYDSGSGNGPFGFGWSLALPAITCKTDKGIPRYAQAFEPDVFVLSGAEDLVPVLVSAGQGLEPHRQLRTAFGRIYDVRRYRPRIEGLFARIESWVNPADASDAFWRSISRDNVTTWYGRSAESRLFDPGDPGRIFSWLICESHDDKGNVVSYRYKEEDSQGLDLARLHERNRTAAGRGAAHYLKRVEYGNRTPYFPDLDEVPRPPLPQDWCFELVFDYGEHDQDAPLPRQEVRAWDVRNDPFSSYRAGFELRTYRLCQRALMFHHFPDEPGVGRDCLVRSTEFEYSFEADPADARNPIYSFLLSAAHAGYRRTESGGYRRSAIPAVAFEYSQPLIDDRIRDIDARSLRNLPYGVDEAAYRWIDLDGEGMPGILTEQAGAWYYKRNESPATGENDGAGIGVRLGPIQVQRSQPLSGASGGPRQLLDLSGDGQLDLVEFTAPLPGFHERTADGGWTDHSTFRSLPGIDWSNPNLRFIDLTGDGHADILITENEAYCWYASLGELGFGPLTRLPKPLDDETGPRVVFADGTESVFIADLSGDGLSDLVRIRNGEVCYWPNLGHGRFGAKVNMDRAPWFDPPDVFDPRRIELADVDGSGTTDILYLGPNEVRIYFNQSGNAWSPPRALRFPAADTLSSAAVVDLLGNGTACLMWSSSLPADQRRPMRYVDLMGGLKPHLLIASRNNLGAETRVRYAPSTRFYVQDRDAGTPWITRLPFPVHVVERVETLDHISRNRFVTRYSYHHGYFDGAEREFRGFGRVDQWDTEEIGILQAGAPTQNVDAASHVPPVRTRTWYHVGAFLDGIAISRQFEVEYWQNEQAGEEPLPDTVLPPGLTLQEAREACRALKGSMLRQEVFSDDGTPQAALPYTVTEQNFSVRRLQVHGVNRHAVFFVHARESIAFHCERNPDDPRRAQQFTLAVDAFGNVLRSGTLAYGRRASDLELLADRLRQTQLLATCGEYEFTNAIDEPDAYRAPLPSSTRSFELTGLALPDGQIRFTLAQIDAAVTQAAIIPYEATADGTLQRRLIEHARSLYRPDDLGVGGGDTTALLPTGEIETMALPGASLQLAFTAGLLTQAYGGRVTDSMMIAAGYTPGDDGSWWIGSGRSFHSPGAGDSAAQELAFARQHFFVPRRFVDPFGNSGSISYDIHGVLPIETRDSLGNTVQTVNDYRVLQPRLIIDPNGNRDEVAFDTLGLVVGNAVMGKPGETLGDTLENFTADLDDAAIAAHLSAPLAAPHDLLQGATTRLVYDLFAYQRTRDDPQPAASVINILARETHRADLAPGVPTSVQHDFRYSDGFGREIQRKIRAEPGPVPRRDAEGRIVLDADGQPELTTSGDAARWVGSGWMIFNNKGKPVRQYEPFFSDTHRPDFDAPIGVSALSFYDPIGRTTATLHPNHSWDKIAFSPWRNETWDVNDTVLIADPATDIDVAGYFRRLPAGDYLPTWHARRAAGAMGAREQAAARKTEVHAGTPYVAHFDALGRPFLIVVHNRFARNGATVDDHHATRAELDIEGRQRAVRDAIVQAGDPLGRIAMRYDFDMLGNVVHSTSMEAGERWMLNDVSGKPLHSWDSRGHALRSEYDALRRPVRQFVRGHDAQDPSAELLCVRTEYGEDVPDAIARNLRTRVFRVSDSGGIVTSEACDFKGNVLHGSRQLAADYRSHPDWAASPALEPEQYSTRTAYDALNRPIAVTTPDASIARPQYDDSGLLERLTVQLRGALEATVLVAGIARDAKGQRERIDYGNGIRTHYQYDRRTFRLTGLRTFRGEERLQDLSYVYDPAGNITDLRDDAQQTVYFGNAVVEPHAEYTYDALYRLIEATGREHIGQMAAPQTSWNDAGRTGLVHPHDGQAMRRYAERYAYDGAGNFLELVHQAAGAGWTRRYDYDEASLIEPEKRSNRLSRTRLGETDEPYTHDVHGNMTAMPHLPLMRWDFQDRLRASARQVVNDGRPQTTWYVYDSAGRRMRKVTESQAGPGEAPRRRSERVDLGGSEIYRDYATDGVTITLERETLHVMDDQQRIALVETRTQGNDGSAAQLVRYQFGNHLGSACLELDRDGTVISYEEYHPYGSTSYQAARSDIEFSPKRYRYTGKERDEETGLSHHGARYCANWLGRWTSADPIGLGDGVNRYQYSRDNPVVFADPTGQYASGGPDDDDAGSNEHHFAGYQHIPEVGEEPLPPVDFIDFEDEPVRVKRPQPATLATPHTRHPEENWQAAVAEGVKTKQILDELPARMRESSERSAGWMALYAGGLVAAPFIIEGAIAAAPALAGGGSLSTRLFLAASDASASIGGGVSIWAQGSRAAAATVAAVESYLAASAAAGGDPSGSTFVAPSKTRIPRPPKVVTSLPHTTIPRASPPAQSVANPRIPDPVGRPIAPGERPTDYGTYMTDQGPLRAYMESSYPNATFQVMEGRRGPDVIPKSGLNFRFGELKSITDKAGALRRQVTTWMQQAKYRSLNIEPGAGRYLFHDKNTGRIYEGVMDVKANWR